MKATKRMRNPTSTIVSRAPMKYSVPAVLKVPTPSLLAIPSKALRMNSAETIRAIQTMKRNTMTPVTALSPAV